MRLQRLSSELIAYAIVAALIVGGSMSALLTTDTRWMEWHLSRLGEGGELSAYVFNFTVGFCALLIGVFAQSIIRDVKKMQLTSAQTRKVLRLLRVTLRLISFGLLGVAAFPFDQFPVIHNVFGYGTTITFVALIALLPKALPVFNRTFARMTYAFIGLLGVLFGIYFATNQRGIPLLYIELLALLYFIAWLAVLVRGTKAKVTSLA